MPVEQFTIRSNTMQKPIIFMLSTALVGLSACNDQKMQSSIETVSAPKDEVKMLADQNVTMEGESREKKETELTRPVVEEMQALVKPSAAKLRQLAAAPAMAVSADAYIVGGILPGLRLPSEPVNTEKYAHLPQNSVQRVSDNPVSTFSIDVDTGSYTNSRRMIADGSLPPEDAVRVEEFINYFSYDNPHPATDSPFSVWTETGPSPWNAQSNLLRVTLDTPVIHSESLKPSNLVFLIDVSGSMQSPDKLELLKKSLKLLARQMGENDSIAIVVYAGASGTVLEPVKGSEVVKVEQALDKLTAGGSTNGASGINLAYQVAQQAFIEGGNNRVILATDGDFNVGTVNHEALLDLVERNREQGIALSTLGFGKGNYNDHLMEQLADHGNGNHAYIDSLFEAQKVLVDEMGSTLQTVAKDVKIQVEFNPQQVKEYRLIGYENRHLQTEDFNNDKVDAGEIGAGHSVTALYEVSYVEQAGMLEPLRYESGQESVSYSADARSGELAYLKIRYKQPDAKQSQLLSYPIMRKPQQSLSATSDDFRFAAAVAAYAQRLKGGKYLNDFSWQAIHELAANSRGRDNNGLRSNFLQLVNMTETLDAVYRKPVAHE
jgi:Ca-activated chloride channel family protein